MSVDFSAVHVGIILKLVNEVGNVSTAYTCDRKPEIPFAQLLFCHVLYQIIFI